MSSRVKQAVLRAASVEKAVVSKQPVQYPEPPRRSPFSWEMAPVSGVVTAIRMDGTRLQSEPTLLTPEEVMRLHVTSRNVEDFINQINKAFTGA